MLEKYKYILLMLLCVQIGNSQAFTENAMLDFKRSAAHLNNYNGIIKSSFWYYNYIVEPISLSSSSDSIVQKNAKSSLMHLNKDVLGWSVFREFGKNGMLTITIDMDIDRSYFGKSEPNYKTASIYSYEQNDLDQKRQIKLQRRQVYPVYNYEILIKINNKIELGCSKNIHERKWEYLLDNQDRIKKEIHYYSVITDFSEVEGLSEDDIKKFQSDYRNRDKLPFTEAEYIYDNHNNVKQLNITTKQKDPIPFHFLDTETVFCPDLHIAYEYDNKDHMTQVTYYGCKDTLAFEKYVYHPEKEYVTERTRYIKSSMRSVTHRTQTMVFYHNQNGDIIEKKYVRNYPQSIFRNKLSSFTRIHLL